MSISVLWFLATEQHQLNLMLQANNRATLQATAALQDSHYSAPLPEMSPDPPQPQGSAGALTQPSTWGGDSAQERLQVVPASLDGLQDAPECVSLDSHMPPASCSRAFLDALRPRSPVERCSPEVAAHAQRSLSGQTKPILLLTFLRTSALHGTLLSQINCKVVDHTS